MAAFRPALLFAAIWTSALIAQPVVPVNLATGRITGKDTGDVQQWLGIPYAAPPVGALRWKSPQPPARWEGVRAMDHYGSFCMQPKLSAVAGSASMSEDCLTLNVWARKGVRNAAVMFWIHGGAFIEGSGALPFYDGTELARQGVVVVTINYRLGDFGFFAHPELTRESGPAEPADNFGFQDQIAALRWVQQNIAGFGGDPHNVTIFGESAGGQSVNFLMTSPVARGLFHRAIAESGGGEARAHTHAELEQEGEARAKQWGATTLAAMRALPAEVIRDTPRRLVLGALAPVIDGKYVLDAPTAGFAAGKQAPVPFLVGANSFEASLMQLFGMSAQSVLALLGPNREKLRQYYGDDPQKQAQGLFTDAVFVAPARYLAAQMEKVKQPAYLYFFDYVTERRRGQGAGAQHGGEIPFVFDNFPPVFGIVATAEDRRMAATVSAAWVQFARTGNPNGPGLPEWPAYTAATDQLLEWAPRIQVRQHFHAQEIDLLTAVTHLRAP